MFVCPSILDTVSMGTPFDSVVVVANVCRARWNVRFFFNTANIGNLFQVGV